MAVFSDNPVLRGYWHAVARVSEVPSAPLKRTLLNQDLVIWRTPDGSVAAGPDRCPHREAPLSEGWCSSDGNLVCPYHGWEFGDRGQLVKVPSSLPGVPVPPTGHLPVYHCRERYGLVWVCLDEPVADIPTIVQDDDPTFRRINNPVEAWTTSAEPVR